MFANVFDPFGLWSFAPRNSGPHVTARQDAAAVYFELDVPRYRPDEITVTSDLDQGLLVVTGKHMVGGTVNAEFERRYSVDTTEVDLAALTTTVENGHATITVPKKPQPPAPTPEETAVATTASTNALALASPSYVAAAGMTWPPKFDMNDSATEVAYTATLPAQLTPDNIDVHLERGGALSVTVRAHVETVKKDDKGNVVHSDSRSLQYTSALGVPRNTRNEDIHVNLKDGSLRITVAKHDGQGRSSIKVNQQ